jgi:hypothetical protein
MAAKQYFNTKFLQNEDGGTELWASYEKNVKKKIFFASLKSMKKGVGYRVRNPDP